MNDFIDLNLKAADEAAMTQALQRLQADQKHLADTLAADLQCIQNPVELKRWLKAQNRAFKSKVD